MNHRNPHGHDGVDGDDPEPGHLPVDPDDGRIPAGLPDDPEQEGIVDPEV